MRETSSLGTLIKDVSDVAAAVFATPSSAKSALAGDPEQMCSEGAGAVGRKIESTEVPGHLSRSRVNRLQGKTCEALFGNLNFRRVEKPKPIFNTKFLPPQWGGADVAAKKAIGK